MKFTSSSSYFPKHVEEEETFRVPFWVQQTRSRTRRRISAATHSHVNWIIRLKLGTKNFTHLFSTRNNFLARSSLSGTWDSHAAASNFCKLFFWLMPNPSIAVKRVLRERKNLARLKESCKRHSHQICENKRHVPFPFPFLEFIKTRPIFPFLLKKSLAKKSQSFAIKHLN